MKLTIFLLAALFSGTCTSNAPTPVNNSNTTGPAAERSEKLESVAAHTTENQDPPNTTSAAKTGPMSSGSPGGDPIDTSEFDAKITAAEKAHKAKPEDAAATAAFAEAYFERGFALTEARQYASALGDYRRSLKLLPTHAESKKWHDQIVGIYEMMKKEVPKEGEEPKPLPFKKV